RTAAARRAAWSTSIAATSARWCATACRASPIPISPNGSRSPAWTPCPRCWTAGRSCWPRRWPSRTCLRSSLGSNSSPHATRPSASVPWKRDDDDDAPAAARTGRGLRAVGSGVSGARPQSGDVRRGARDARVDAGFAARAGGARCRLRQRALPVARTAARRDARDRRGPVATHAGTRRRGAGQLAHRRAGLPAAGEPAGPAGAGCPGGPDDLRSGRRTSRQLGAGAGRAAPGDPARRHPAVQRRASDRACAGLAARFQVRGQPLRRAAHAAPVRRLACRLRRVRAAHRAGAGTHASPRRHPRRRALRPPGAGGSRRAGVPLAARTRFRFRLHAGLPMTAPRTLLINPTVTSRSSARFPLGLLQLAAALDRSGSSRIIDGNVDRDFVNDSLRAMEQERFDAVGVGVMGGPQVATAIAVSKAIREHFPAAPIVWGGYFPTLHTDATLAAPYVDYAIRAQGEQALPELVAALAGDQPALERIAGLSWKRAGTVVHNPARPIMRHDPAGLLPYDKLGDPRRYLARTYLGQRTVATQAAIGCRYHCTFCGVAAMFGGATQLPAAARLERELTYFKHTLGADAVQYFDHNFFDREADMLPLLEVMARFELPWWCFARSDALLKLSEHAWKLVRKSRLRMAYIGAESPSGQMLHDIRKGTRPDQTLEVVELCR